MPDPPNATWLDKFFSTLAIRWNGAAVPPRSNLNFLGGTVADDPGNDQTVVTLGGGGGGGGIQLEDAASALLTVRTKLQFANGTIVDDPGNGRSIYTAPTPPPAGMPMNGYFLSLVDHGAARGAGEAGNFSVGINFLFLMPCTWTGVRFNATYGGTKSWKARAYDLTAAAALGTVTSAPIASGTSVLTFASPIPIVSILHTYVASVYDTSGAIYAGYTYIGGPDESIGSNIYGRGFLLGPKMMLVDNSFFAAGDSQPTAGSSTERMAVEPIFTIP